MPYIGNTVQNQGFAPAIDYFNGNGVTVTFTLSRPVASVAQLIVAIDNVIQNPSSSFTVAGNSITFTSAPLSGTNNIWVEYTSLITTYQGISQDPTVIGDIRATGGYLAEGDFGNSFVDGAILDYVTGRGRVTVGDLDDITFYHGGTAGRSAMMDLYYAGGAKIYGTTALTLPSGTTGERPGTPVNGMIRNNSTTNLVEVYQSGAWQSILASSSGYLVETLVVAGGGAGGGANTPEGGGGGGAGGYISTTQIVTSSQGYGVTIGAGGTGVASGGGSGGNSAFGSIAAIGGGGGAKGSGTVGNGGSGGGGGSATGSGTPGTGTSGQGNSGGTGLSTPRAAGGGGGAGAVGGNGTAGSIPGSGGVGLQWLNGTFYAGGGGGSGDGTNFGAGGNGGGGAGGSSGFGTVGTANTGGGGGGSYGSSNAGANGGSGVVIVRYLGSTRGSGGTITSAGGYTYHTFTTSGTFTA